MPFTIRHLKSKRTRRMDLCVCFSMSANTPNSRFVGEYLIIRLRPRRRA
jgi:hypothetical protein